MNDEDLGKLKHMLDAVVEHCRLQGQKFEYSVLRNEAPVWGVAVRVKFWPELKIPYWHLQFEVGGETRDAVLDHIQQAMRGTHRGVAKFLGDAL